MKNDEVNINLTSRENLALILLTIVTVSVSLNIGISLFLVPKISLDLGNVVAEWGIIVQSIFIVSLYLCFGKIGDLIGLSAMCRYGACFLAAGFYSFFLCTNSTVYLIACILTGIGTAMFSSVSGGLIRNIFPSSRISFGFSVMYFGYGAGFIVGPFLLAYIENFYSWQIFYLLLTPLPLILVCLLGRIMDCKPNRISLKMIDIPGAILLMLTLFFIYTTIIQIFKNHISQSEILFLICAFFTLIVLIWHEKNAKLPFLDLNIIRRPELLILIGILMIMALLYRSYLFYFQLYFEDMVNVSSNLTALYLLIPGISFLPLAVLIGYFGCNWNKKRFIQICIFGCFIGIAGVFIHGFFSVLYPLIALVFFGAYNACIRIASYTLYFLSVSHDEAGITGGLMETGIAFINPLVITITGFFFHSGFHLYSANPICWQKITDGFMYGNLGVSLFYISCLIVQILLLMILRKLIFSHSNI